MHTQPTHRAHKPLSTARAAALVFFILATAVSVAMLIIAAVGSRSDAPTTSTDTPSTGNSAVVKRIDAETDCKTLQVEFDSADHYHKTDVMDAAQARMEKVGCFR